MAFVFNEVEPQSGQVQDALKRTLLGISTELLITVFVRPGNTTGIQGSVLGFGVLNDFLAGRIVTHKAQLGFGHAVFACPLFGPALGSTHAQTVLQVEPKGIDPTMQDNLSTMYSCCDKLADWAHLVELRSQLLHELLGVSATGAVQL